MPSQGSSPTFLCCNTQFRLPAPLGKTSTVYLSIKYTSVLLCTQNHREGIGFTQPPQKAFLKFPLDAPAQATSRISEQAEHECVLWYIIHISIIRISHYSKAIWCLVCFVWCFGFFFKSPANPEAGDEEEEGQVKHYFYMIQTFFLHDFISPQKIPSHQNQMEPSPPWKIKNQKGKGWGRIHLMLPLLSQLIIWGSLGSPWGPTEH